jgi:hypothetical protein
MGGAAAYTLAQELLLKGTLSQCVNPRLAYSVYKVFYIRSICRNKVLSEIHHCFLRFLVAITAPFGYYGSFGSLGYYCSFCYFGSLAILAFLALQALFCS